MGASSSSLSVSSRVWIANDSFPEQEAKVYLPSDQDIGVAFSGGGSRSAAASLGYLRGLLSMTANVTSRLKILSAVSGGAWMTVPFTWLPSHITDAQFLGSMEEAGMFEKALSQITNSNLLRRLVSTLSAGDETYGRLMARFLLNPFGLDDPGRFFTHPSQIDDILQRNPDLSPDNFHVSRPGRPFLVVGSVLLMPKGQYRPVETTPFYTGIRHVLDLKDAEQRLVGRIGGGYIESLGYDSNAPETPPPGDGSAVKLQLENTKNIFALSDILGSTSAAPQETINSWKILNILGRIFPSYYHWSPRPTSDKKILPESDHVHTDGGVLENLGIMPLLARKVKNIIVFVNTSTPLIVEGDTAKNLDLSVAALFAPGVPNRPNAPAQPPASSGALFDVNVVFEANKLEDLKRGFAQRLKKGKPLVHLDTYDVRDNELYGIRRYQARILWVYLSNPGQEWERTLSAEEREDLRKTNEEQRECRFTNNQFFPHYGTFVNLDTSNILWLGFDLVGLDLHEIRLLSKLCHWTVCHKSTQKRIRRFFS